MAGGDEAIEDRLADRYGRPALCCPSGRLALFLALIDRFEPGQRLLMSPVDDDVVVVTVLAAGLRPVMAPIDPADGNIAVHAVPRPLWDTLDGVLTTNLYGIPDRASALRERCDDHGLELIEDVAHALVIDDESGRPVGHRGDAVIVSFSKHGRGPGGGALLVGDRTRLKGVRDHRDRLCDRQGPIGWLRTAAGRGLRATALDRWAVPLRERLAGPTREAHRMAVRPDELRRALATAPGLAAADPWVGIDNRRYRDRPTGSDRRAALAALDRADREADTRRIGVERLRGLPGAAPGVRDRPATPLFRVPLLLADRDRVASVMRAAGLPLHYVYDPPLDDLLGPEFVDPSPDPMVGRTWSAHALPVDPLHAERFLDLCAEAGGDLLTPLEW